MAPRISIYHHYEGLNARTPKSKMRPFTCQDRFIRDVRNKKHAGGRPRVWHKCPWCSLKFNGRQWLSHEYNCPRGPCVESPSRWSTSGASRRESGASLRSNGTSARFARTSLRGGLG